MNPEPAPKKKRGRPRVWRDDKERMRAYRERKKQGMVQPATPIPTSSVCDWIRDTLIVPPGHPRAGEPWNLMDWQERFIDDVIDPSTVEGALCIARKNGKTALVAALVLAYLVGPLRSPGWRAGILSISRPKAGELLQQVEDITKASPKVKGVEIRRTPVPGHILGPDGRVEVESADRGAGHASGFDLSIIDELGLLPERYRSLVAGMRSATTAKGGKFLSLSIIGDGPFMGEIIARDGEPGLKVHNFRAEGRREPRVDDEAAWAAANPGLGVIIDAATFRAQARRVIATPADAPFFIAHHLNRIVSTAAEPLLHRSEWEEVQDRGYPPRRGACVVGLDLGESKSMTCAAVIWESGRLEVYSAFPSEPNLLDRGRADGAGGRYQFAADEGHLWVLGDAQTFRLTEFVERLADALDGETVEAIGGDRARKAELEDAIRTHWDYAIEPVGSALEVAEAVRAFRRHIHRGDIRPGPDQPMLEWALSLAEVRRDPQGNPKLDRSNPRKRIDPAVASAAAASLYSRHLHDRDSGSTSGWSPTGY